MLQDGKICIGKGEQNVFMYPSMLNRHGLIAGATGTGKTTTLKVLAEDLSLLGVPVFLADIKGDLGGCAVPGTMSDKLQARLSGMGIDHVDFQSFPVHFFDVYGEKGHPVRTTVSEMGPLLLGRLLGLSDVQEDVLNLIFRIADDNNLLLVDTKDLRAMIEYVSNHVKDYTANYGAMSKQSLGAIQRNLLSLDDQGGDIFFGEPSLDLRDWMERDIDGKGYINILHCERLFQSPILYSTFMLWMMSELYEMMPEAGDCEKPKIAFFFDEAHLLFRDAPRVLLDKIEQMVKLIRSKGVAVFFITQAPTDIPAPVLAQLSNRIQHALRAYTPAEQKVLKSTAESFRENPKFDTMEALTSLGVGEALISALDEKGIPTVVERAMIVCPASQMGAIDDSLRNSIIQKSDLYGKYEKGIDNQSAYEILSEKAKNEQERKEAAEQAAAEAKARAVQEKELEKLNKEAAREAEKQRKEEERQKAKSMKYVNKVTNSALSAVGREVGRKVARGLFGSFKW